MKIIRTVAELRSTLSDIRSAGKSIGLVPTMGALHEGHLSLMRRARDENDVVVASLFVNPTQFNNPDDLRTYPRTEQADCQLMESVGVDFAFIPSVEEIYPEPDTRIFDLGPVAEVMEGPMRPGHFNGVAQIVSKLFDMVRPTRAYFGEKDFQQIAVIRRMVEIEGFDLTIVPCPIMRHDDGLAMSSRNVRLTPQGRSQATWINAVLRRSLSLANDGASVDEVTRFVIEAINANPLLSVEYFLIVDSTTMQPVTDWSRPTVGCVTVHCTGVRLIDNIQYPSHPVDK